MQTRGLALQQGASKPIKICSEGRELKLKTLARVFNSLLLGELLVNLHVPLEQLSARSKYSLETLTIKLSTANVGERGDSGMPLVTLRVTKK